MVESPGIRERKDKAVFARCLRVIRGIGGSQPRLAETDKVITDVN